MTRTIFFCLYLTVQLLVATTSNVWSQATESECSDGQDNDGDSVFDCGDADCKEDPACKADGRRENSNARCSDWLDNDSNGLTDCDDSSCQTSAITVCQGSWSGKKKPGRFDAATSAASSDSPSDADADLPELSGDLSVEDLIGKGRDNDGERNNWLCSDGFDNDNDGRTDCADFGCRFDPTVTICQGDPDLRFSVVGRIEQTNQFDYPAKDRLPDAPDIRQDARISRLQLRAFGPLPSIADSFFLLSMRTERTPRLSFAMFQIPLGRGGHYLNLNSGSGGLSTTLVRSAHKRLLMEPAFYVYNAFEQGNGGALEIGGPLDRKGKFLYRTYMAGGSGRFNGNIGGGFFADDNRNFTWSVGGQLTANLIGYYSRWDSPVLYTPVPLTLVTSVGLKYDQRAFERFPALNVQATFRWRRLMFLAETYMRRELEFKFSQISYNFQVGFLLIKKRLLLAADFGEFLSEDIPQEDLTTPLPDDLARQLQETQYRFAAHIFLWRNVLQAVVLYTDRTVDPRPGETSTSDTRALSFIGQYRF